MSIQRLQRDKFDQNINNIINMIKNGRSQNEIAMAYNFSPEWFRIKVKLMLDSNTRKRLAENGRKRMKDGQHIARYREHLRKCTHSRDH